MVSTNLVIDFSVFEIHHHSSHKVVKFENANHDPVLILDLYNGHNVDDNKNHRGHVRRPTPNNENNHVDHVNTFVANEFKYSMYCFFHLRHRLVG